MENRLFASVAVELLRELKRNENQLLPYDHVRVRKVVEEMATLFDDLQAALQEFEGEGANNEALAPYFCVYHHSLMRNKRCLLAYLNARMRLLMRYRWHLGRASLPLAVQENMSSSESRFLTEYDELVTEYEKDVHIDLGASLVPPKQLHVEVRVKKDLGEVQLDSGTVVLKPGMTHFLVRGEVEHLIRQGVLEQVG